MEYQKGMIQNMSVKGNCYDNGVAEVQTKKWYNHYSFKIIQKKLESQVSSTKWIYPNIQKIFRSSHLTTCRWSDSTIFFIIKLLEDKALLSLHPL